MTTHKIILASTSPYRKKLLIQLNIPFTVLPPAVDEEELKKNSSVSLPDLPLFLAKKKAESLCSLYPQNIIIGCDQLGMIHTTAIHKSGSRARAIEQLKSLQGQTHSLITAFSVHSMGHWYHHVDTTHLHMRQLTDEQIIRYVDLENPIDCAGSYKIEGLGIALFEKIETQDPTAIVGLPLMALSRILEKIGLSSI